jgi:transcriptional regulator with XRE-family HTH domain
MSKKDLLNGKGRLDLTGSSEPGRIPTAEAVGFVVSSARKLCQWKRSTLADFARVSLSTVERVERGEKVSEEALERITEAFGLDRGYLTGPLFRKSFGEVVAEFVAAFRDMTPVSVKPLRLQRQIRVLAKCHSFIAYRRHVGDEYDKEVTELTEWLHLASGLFSTPDPSERGRRRELYSSVLDSVRRLEARGVTVLAGVMETPQPSVPDWKMAVISLTSKLFDPGALKRKVVLVDRRYLAQLPPRELSTNSLKGEWEARRPLSE